MEWRVNEGDIGWNGKTFNCVEVKKGVIGWISKAFNYGKNNGTA